MDLLDTWIPRLQEYGLTYGIAVIKAIAIFVIGKWVVKKIANFAEKMMQKSQMDEMLSKFLRNIIYALLLAFVVIAAIGAIGVQTASLVAIIGAAGLAVGLALQGALANFAAGVLMIIFRPYKIGDVVEVAGQTGKVEEVDIFTTVLRTPDSVKVTIPNGQIMNDVITNFTDAELRRLEGSVGIGYGDDIDKAREVLLKAVAESPFVVDEPAPSITVSELGDSSVNLAVRPWVEAAKYPPASHDINERVKKALDAAGISIPFPQRDVHVFEHKD